MRRKLGLLLAGLALLALLWTPEAALADRIEMNVTYYVGHGETILPDYPDYSSQIGAGLTKDHFKITYETAGGSVFVDPDTGALTGNPNGPFNYDNLYITYTPIKSGVGKKQVYHCYVYTSPALTSIPLSKDEVLINDTGAAVVSFEFAEKRIPAFRLTGYDERIVTATLGSRGAGDLSQKVNIKGVAPGETTVTVVAYNGVTADIHVTVKRTPTSVSFAQDEFVCYVGDKIPLGIEYGGSEYYPTFYAKVTYEGKGKYHFEDDLYGLFCPESAADYTINVTDGTLSAKALVRVYDPEVIASMKASRETIRVGDSFTVQAYDANNKALRVQTYEITQGAELVQWKDNRLVAAGVGEFEISAYNRDGSAFRQTFVVEPKPTRMTLNATELTMEIGERFDIEVTFDQGSYPVYYDTSYQSPSWTAVAKNPIRLIGDGFVAQYPGTVRCDVHADGDRSVTASILVTVKDGNKLATIEGPDVCAVGQSIQLYVADRTGKIYPATFSADSSPDYDLTPAGYFTVNSYNHGTPYFVNATLADGRIARKEIMTVQVPKWLESAGMIVYLNDSEWCNVNSDIGTVEEKYLTYESADESIATVTYGRVYGKKLGTTTITVRYALDPKISTTFAVEVIPDNSDIYLATPVIYVPAGSVRPLPVVHNGAGQEIPITWKVTRADTEEGLSAFAIEDGYISCSSAATSCELTGTIKGTSKKVKVSVFGYALPENIRLEPVQVWLEIGETQEIKLEAEDGIGRWGVIYWESADSGIATVSPYTESDKNTVTAVAAGETLVGAVLENGAMAMCVVNVYDPNARLPGDVNEDGRVDTKDALIVMKYCAGWPVKLNGWQGDVNADGSTDLHDAILLFQHDAGLDVELKQYIPPD